MSRTQLLLLLVGTFAAYIAFWTAVWVWWYRSNRTDRIAAYTLLAHIESLQQEDNNE